MTVLAICTPGQLGEALGAGPELVYTLEPGLGGAWTELHGATELIRFGYPASSPNPWFQVTRNPGPRRHNAATLALERIVYIRRITTVLLAEPAWQPMVKRALALHGAVELRVRGASVSTGDFLAARGAEAVR